ncbi:MAG TPA: ATPase domain-containing protein [Thermoplasmata archaeon]|nr:ATPase domain-containing protein [Thermoplasmata archaeon]
MIPETAQLPAARVRSYVTNLDEQMEGGIPRGSIVLVCGRPGSMKSSLTYYMMHRQATVEGQRCVYVTLEQSRASLVRHLSHIGIDAEASGRVAIVDLAQLRKSFGDDGPKGDTNWLKAIVDQVASYKQLLGCEIVALDSMSALYSLHEFTNPRRELFHFFEGMRALGVTVFLISEMYDPEKDIFARYEVEDFLADGVLHLKVDRSDGQSNLYLGIVKLRETRHSRSYFPLIVEGEGFEVVAH